MRCTLKRDILFLKGWRRGCWANKYMYIIIIIIVVCYSHLAQFLENHNSLVSSHVLQIVRTYVIAMAAKRNLNCMLGWGSAIRMKWRSFLSAKFRIQ